MFLPRTKLKADARHTFREQVAKIGPVTHVRLNIYPDGGVSRLRLFGRVEVEAQEAAAEAADSVARNEAGAIAALNDLSGEEARKALLDCCGSAKWVDVMARLVPFANAERLLEAADRVWAGLEESDWLEAFRHHPAIGSKKSATKRSSTAKTWSAGEQSRAQEASEETLAQLAEANQAYHAKFGIVFLICATGKSAEEILAALRSRIANDWATEVKIAAEEQRKITRIRLEKLLAS